MNAMAFLIAFRFQMKKGVIENRGNPTLNELFIDNPYYTLSNEAWFSIEISRNMLCKKTIKKNRQLKMNKSNLENLKRPSDHSDPLKAII